MMPKTTSQCKATSSRLCALAAGAVHWLLGSSSLWDLWGRLRLLQPAVPQPLWGSGAGRDGPHGLLHALGEPWLLLGRTLERRIHPEDLRGSLAHVSYARGPGCRGAGGRG